MRIKIAIVAFFGLLLGIVPMTGAVQAAPVTASVRVIHGVPGTTVDVWVNGTKAIDDFTPGAEVDTTLPEGSNAVVVCGSTSTSAACAGAGGASIMAGTFVLAGGANYTLVAAVTSETPSFALQLFSNNQDPTSYGMSRFQLNNNLGVFMGGPVSICLDGVKVPGLTDIAGGAFLTS